METSFRAEGFKGSHTLCNVRLWASMFVSVSFLFFVCFLFLDKVSLCSYAGLTS